MNYRIPSKFLGLLILNGIVGACSGPPPLDITPLESQKEVSANQTLLFIAEEPISANAQLNLWQSTDSSIKCTPSTDLEFYWRSEDTLELRAKPYFPLGELMTIEISRHFFSPEIAERLKADIIQTYQTAKPLIEDMNGRWISASESSSNSTLLISIQYSYPVNPLDAIDQTEILVNKVEYPKSLVGTSAGTEISYQIDIRDQVDSLKVRIALDSGFSTTDGLFQLTQRMPLGQLLFNQRAVVSTKSFSSLKEGKTQSAKSVLSEDGTLEDVERLEKLDKAIDKGNEGESILFSKAVTLTRLGKFKEGIAIYDQLIARGNKTAANYSNRGVAKNALSQYTSALNDFEQAIRIDSNYTMAFVNKGFTLIMLERFEESIIALNKSLELDKSHAIALNNKGFAQLKLGMIEEAAKSLNKSEKHNPYNSWLYRNKACLFAISGRKDEALSSLDKAIKMGYNDKFWIENEASLASLRNTSAYKKIIDQL